MESGILGFVNDYGYWAVFILVFLQEIGIPNPIPNEVVLLFAGALSTIGDLNFFLVFLTAVAADMIGTTILYLAFYFFEKQIVERMPAWSPVNKNLEKFKAKIMRGGRWAIFVGRLIPFLRGYISIAAGVLNIPYYVFIPIVASSAILWSGGYVVIGHFVGEQWEIVGDTIGRYVWSLLAVIVVSFIIWTIVKRIRSRRALKSD